MKSWNCFLGTLQPFVGSRFVRPPMLSRSLFCKAPWYGEVVGSRILIHKVLVATCQDVKVPKELRHHFLKILLKENFLLPHTTVLQKRSVMRWCTCQDEDISFWPVVCFWYLTFAGAFNVVETSTGAGQRSAHVGFKRKHILQGRKHPRPDHMDS